MKNILRVIEAEQITDIVAGLSIEANIYINDDIRSALVKAREAETSQLAGSALDVLLDNIETAQCGKMPVCQDTGMAVVFVEIGENIHINGSIEKAVNEGIRRGYREGYLRSSVVADPAERVNTGDNTPAVIHFDIVPGDSLRITVAPKGFGSENMSAVKMLMPSDGLQGIEDFIAGTVKKAGACPCPPVIVGAGIGGTMEKAALMAKKALLRDVGSIHPDVKWAQVEERLLKRINNLGIGASGYGGITTALGVHVMTYPTHIAGLPVAVNIGCHATRHKTCVL